MRSLANRCRKDVCGQRSLTFIGMLYDIWNGTAEQHSSQKLEAPQWGRFRCIRQVSESGRDVQASHHFAATHFKHTLQIWPQAHMDQPALALHLTKTITVSFVCLLNAQDGFDYRFWYSTIESSKQSCGFGVYGFLPSAFISSLSPSFGSLLLSQSVFFLRSAASHIKDSGKDGNTSMGVCCKILCYCKRSDMYWSNKTSRLPCMSGVVAKAPCMQGTWGLAATSLCFIILPCP